MRYYKIDNSIDLKLIGTFPQIQLFTENYDSKRKNSCSRIGRYISSVPDMDFDFDGLKLAEKAKLTDLLSASYMSNLSGLFVSPLLFDFLNKLRTVEYIRYPAKIYRGGELILEHFSWLHYSKSYPSFIDFKKSIFYLDHSDIKYKKLTIASYESYLREKENTNYIIESKQLVLKKELVSQFDVLRIGVVNFDTYVTEDVKNRMTDNGFTGIVYEPADYLMIDC